VSVIGQELARRRYARALERDLTSLVVQLSQMPAVHRVILFGSYAAGRRDLFTDLDILVVMDSQQDFVARTAELGRQLRAGVALDVLAYTPQEMERMRDRPFVRHALQTGKVLYERRATS
jgi:predicted nucleotidyltransferase